MSNEEEKQPKRNYVTDVIKTLKEHPYLITFALGILIIANAAGNLTGDSNIMWLIIGAGMIFGAFAAHEGNHRMTLPPW